MLGPVLEQQGEVLRFIGDAALAIFPVGAAHREACERALAAAQKAMARMEELNAGRPGGALRFGIGLHLGDVLYGNVGTPGRIEFTVIGAAANEAARIEALCKDLGTPLVVSEAVVRGLPPDLARRLTSLTLASVVVSVVVHGISATPLMAWYGKRRAAASSP